MNEVVLNCTVVDESKKLVRDLKRGDFEVWEDGVPQTIDSFQFQDLPVSMGILVDNSGSMRDKRAAVDAAALDLVKASNPDDEAFVVNFSDKAYLDQGFTSNVSALERGLTSILVIRPRCTMLLSPPRTSLPSRESSRSKYC